VAFFSALTFFLDLLVFGLDVEDLPKL